MKSAIDISGTGYEATGEQKNMSGTWNYTGTKIPVMELDKSLDFLGEKGKKNLMTYIQANNPKTSDGCVEVGMIDTVLKTVFGEASDLLMKQILHQ
jgi:hypothetical protein